MKGKVFIGLAIFFAALLGFSASHFLQAAKEHSKGNHSHGSPSKHNEESHGYSSEKGEHDEHKEGEEDLHNRTVSLSPEEMEEFDIRVEKAAPGELVERLRLTGKVEFHPAGLAHIVPRLAGIAQEIRKNVGDKVKKGELLAVLESPELAELKMRYLELHRRLEIAKIDYERARAIYRNTQKLLRLLTKYPKLEELRREMKGLELGENRQKLIGSYANLVFAREKYKIEKELLKQKISSLSDYLTAQNNYKRAQAEFYTNYDEVAFTIRRELANQKQKLVSLEASHRTMHQLLKVYGLSQQDLQKLEEAKEPAENLGRIELRAPFDGTIIERHIVLGERLDVEDVPFVVANTEKVWVALSVYQPDLVKVRPGQKALIAFHAAGMSGCNCKELLCQKKQIESTPSTLVTWGTIKFVTPTLDEQTRTATAFIEIPNPKGLWRVGMFVHAYVEVQRFQVNLRIPREAIQIIEEKPYVFVEVRKNTFQLREIEIGRQDLLFAEVRKGLKPEEKYVSKNGFILKSELLKSTIEAGHTH